MPSRRILVASGSFNSGTGAVSSTVGVTGVGFRPKVVMFWWTHLTQTTDGVQTAAPGDAAMGFGWMINDNNHGAPTARRAAASSSADAATSGAAGCRMQNNACVLELGGSGAMNGLLDGQSFDVDGFTLIVDDQCTSSIRIHYLALGGEGIEAIASGRAALPTAAGDVDYTAGFRPDVVFCVGIRGTSENTDLNHGVLSLGCAVNGGGATRQGVATVCSFNGNTSMFTEGYQYNGEVLALPLPAAVSPQTLESRASLVQMNNDGFRLNWIETPGVAASQFMWLAIKGGQWDVFEGLTLTDTTTDIPAIVGFTPRAGLVFATGRTVSTQDVMTAHVGLSVGSFVGLGSQRCFFMNDEDGVGTALTAAGVEHDNVLGMFNLTTQALDALMNVNSLTPSGVNFRMTDAASAGTHFFGVMVGDKSTPLNNYAHARGESGMDGAERTW